jgi:prolyl-tRNA synthetase
MRTRLFLRTTEFLWQEGHTAHATANEAVEETMRMLDVYRRFAEEYMAMPVIPGRKTEAERFAGAVDTYSIEAMMQDRRALQAGTSHFLGQNFAKAFDVTFQNEGGALEHVWATSWGVSTRLIGALIMTHSDDQGLVLPPKLAPLQAVLVPIYRKDEEKTAVLEAAKKITEALSARFSIKLDDREGVSPGFKFNDWELRGVPVRLELGPRDLTARQVVAVRRDTGKKAPIAMDALEDSLRKLLDEIPGNLFERARKLRDDNTVELSTYEELKSLMASDSKFVRAWWAGSRQDEERLAEETKATVRNIPVEQRPGKGRCIMTGAQTDQTVIIAKAY